VGEGGDDVFDFTDDGGDCRLGKGGGMTMHDLSSSPSNIVSMARFLDRVGEGDRRVSVEGWGSCIAGCSGRVGGGEGFPSVWDCASESASPRSFKSASGTESSVDDGFVLSICLTSLMVLCLVVGSMLC
jgi:hypothetical protein